MVRRSMSSMLRLRRLSGMSAASSSLGCLRWCSAVSIVYSGGPYDTIVKSAPSRKISADDSGSS